MNKIKIGKFIFLQSAPGEPITYIHMDEPGRELPCTTHSGAPRQAIQEELKNLHSTPCADE